MMPPPTSNRDRRDNGMIDLTQDNDIVATVAKRTEVIDLDAMEASESEGQSDAEQARPEFELPAGVDIVDLDNALEHLSQMEPRLAQTIELHYFGGLTYDQIATFVNASAATVHRDIRLARAWLLNYMAIRPA